MEIYPGSAISVWNNFDQDFIYNLIDKTIELRKKSMGDQPIDNSVDKYESPEEIEKHFNERMTAEQLKKIETLKVKMGLN